MPFLSQNIEIYFVTKFKNMFRAENVGLFALEADSAFSKTLAGVLLLLLSVHLKQWSLPDRL